LCELKESAQDLYNIALELDNENVTLQEEIDIQRFSIQELSRQKVELQNIVAITNGYIEEKIKLGMYQEKCNCINCKYISIMKQRLGMVK